MTGRGVGDAGHLELDEHQELVRIIRGWRQPWWWRARRRLAFYVGLDLGMPWLGYLIDVDRDRHR